MKVYKNYTKNMDIFKEETISLTLAGIEGIRENKKYNNLL